MSLAALTALVLSAAPPDAAEALVAQARAAFDAQDYELAIPPLTRALALEGLTVERRVELYRMLGSAVAITRDPAEAEAPFLQLLRLQPDFDLPARTPPKILSVFRKVQADERIAREALHRAERQKKKASIELVDPLPEAGRGGRPLQLSLRIRDPNALVESVRFAWRTTALPAFASAPLGRSPSGAWEGSVPGEATANSSGAVLECFLQAADAEGPLLEVGSAQAPRSVHLVPGQVQRERPKPLPPAVFGTSAAFTVAAAIAWAAVGGSAKWWEGRVAAFCPGAGQSCQGTAEERTLLIAKADSLAGATNGLIATTLALAVVTAAIAFLTQWAPPDT